ncbi:hypothetical protein L5515_018784 [Caenorhabditis briggsae]|uniref:Uncharacterized protein n=1 Tax=Caenorhabditis briggsae TaxID=6238 RepID=A0AAE9FI31_CAEBR|nr:hypothetical protein L5515_018784 [Caenorhabditis briggsae]
MALHVILPSDICGGRFKNGMPQKDSGLNIGCILMENCRMTGNKQERSDYSLIIARNRYQAEKIVHRKPRTIFSQAPSSSSGGKMMNKARSSQLDPPLDNAIQGAIFLSRGSPWQIHLLLDGQLRRSRSKNISMPRYATGNGDGEEVALMDVNVLLMLLDVQLDHREILDLIEINNTLDKMDSHWLIPEVLENNASHAQLNQQDPHDQMKMLAEPTGSLGMPGPD